MALHASSLSGILEPLISANDLVLSSLSQAVLSALGHVQDIPRIDFREPPSPPASLGARTTENIAGRNFRVAPCSFPVKGFGFPEKIHHEQEDRTSGAARICHQKWRTA
jgi:hypothetical protein